LASLFEFLHGKLQIKIIIYAIITVYTGICSGQLTEWYPHRIFENNKRCQPWEHRRQGRFRADTFLNKMTHRQYRSLFSKYFEILTDESVHPGVWKEFLTD